jgi:Uma2 family endonuclease
MVRHVVTRIPHRYLRETAPVYFPTSDEMPETRRHMGLRTALFQIFELAFADRATLGSEQFVYSDPTNPRVCCAPDLMLRLGEPDEPFDIWKTWERGAPHLAIEIVSASDHDRGPWEDKLDRHKRMGVQELVRFDPDDPEAQIRIWDRVEFDLVERDRSRGDFSRCRTLDVYFCVREDEKLGPMLRISRDAEGQDLFPTLAEARRAAAEARERADQAREQADRARAQADQAREQADQAREQADQAREQADQARLAAEARVRELEAELARRARDEPR